MAVSLGCAHGSAISVRRARREQPRVNLEECLTYLRTMQDQLGWKKWQWGLAFPLIVSLPIVAFAIATVAKVSDQEQRSIEGRILDLARSSIERSDAVLHARISFIDFLASNFQEGSSRVFVEGAERLIEASSVWREIVIRDGQGEILAAVPASASIARIPLPSGASQGVESAIARVVPGAPPLLHLHRRVSADGQPDLFVSAALDLAPFSLALSTQDAPDTWIRAVLDDQLVIAGRSRAEEKFVGVAATPSLAQEIAEADERFFYARNQEGERVYTAFSTSAAFGWTAAVGAPAALVEAPLRETRWAWIAGGLLSLILASLLAWLFAQALTKQEAAEKLAWQLESDRRSESRLSEIAAHFPGVIFRRVMKPDGRISFPYVSPGIERLFDAGENGDLSTGTHSLDALARRFMKEEDRPAWKNALLKSAMDLSTFDVEGRLALGERPEIWVRSMGNAWRDAHGNIVWDGVVMDITPVKQAERRLELQTRALRKISGINAKIASEIDRDRLIQYVLDAGRELVGAQFGAFFYNVIGEAGDSYMLYSLSGARPEDFTKFPMPRSTSVFAPTFRGEGIVRSDDITRDPRYGRNAPHSGMPEGHLPVRSYLAAPVISRDGSVLGGLFYGHEEPGQFSADAADALEGVAAQAAVALDNSSLFRAAERELAQRREAEAHQRMLLNELDHRVKNSLAVVLAIANQTARNTSNFTEFNVVFAGRVQALAQAHTLLSEGRWQTTGLRDLVRTTLGAICDPCDPRISTSGPALDLPPRHTLALSLILHELATNASKYGALATCEGSLEVAWSLGTDGQIRIDWHETATTNVIGPTRMGFGSRLIEMNVSGELNGRFSREFTPSGLHVKIEWPHRTNRDN